MKIFKRLLFSILFVACDIMAIICIVINTISEIFRRCHTLMYNLAMSLA